MLNRYDVQPHGTVWRVRNRRTGDTALANGVPRLHETRDAAQEDVDRLNENAEERAATLAS